MKITFFLSFMILASQIIAGSLSSEKHLATLINQNVHAMNAIVKRGDYTAVKEYQQTIQMLHMQVKQIGNTQLDSQINLYDGMVRRLSSALQEHAPDLNHNNHAIINGLEDFNHRISSIGLVELIQGWRELGNLKKRFVRKPDTALSKAFNTQWLYVTSLINELYLDEEYETPMLKFLQLYKHTFETIDTSYKEAGYDTVATLKPLSYEIKSTIIMLQRSM